MINVLVTGGGGQLAKCIKDIENRFQNLNILYLNSSVLDITNLKDLSEFFNNNSFDYCINCAAYTAVDKSENDQKSAYNVNEFGCKNLALVCKKHNSTLIHVSTDFVFDGKQSLMYNEENQTNPINIYGKSKLNGEIQIQENISKYFIIRTSWLYSEHGYNFMKTMLKLEVEKKKLSIVVDQIGTPTYAKDLASVILQLISTKNNQYGVYHYSNEGVASWYDFAKAIFEETNSEIKILPIKAIDYPTPAERPKFSVLDKSKIKDTLQIEIPYWRDSLKTAILNYNE